jgi:hypothetical protein
MGEAPSACDAEDEGTTTTVPVPSEHDHEGVTVHKPIVAPACRPVLVADAVSPLLIAQLAAIEAAVLAELDEERG